MGPAPARFNDSVVPLSIPFRNPVVKVPDGHAIAGEEAGFHRPHSRGIRYGELVCNVMWIPGDEQQRPVPDFEGRGPPSIHQTFGTEEVPAGGLLDRSRV